MKKLLFFLFILALTANNFSCKKNPENPPIILTDTIPYDSAEIDTNNFEPIIQTGIYFHLSLISLDSIKRMLNGKWTIKSGVWYTNSHVELMNNNDIDSIKWYNDTTIFKNGVAGWIKRDLGNNRDSSVHINLPNSFYRSWMLEYGNADSFYVYEGEYRYFLIRDR
jgi:hypothetical protein